MFLPPYPRSFAKLPPPAEPGYFTWNGPEHIEPGEERHVPHKVALCGHANTDENACCIEENGKLKLCCRLCLEVQQERWRNAIEYADGDEMYVHKRCGMIWRCVPYGPEQCRPRGRRTTNRLIGISFGEVDRSENSAPTGDEDFLINTLGLPRELVIDVRDALPRDPHNRTRGTYHNRSTRREVQERVMREENAKLLLALLYIDWQRYGVIAVGCYGSNHRSPSILGMMDELARSHGWDTCIRHFGDVRTNRYSPEIKDWLVQQKRTHLQELLKFDGISSVNSSWEPSKYYAHEFCEREAAERERQATERAAARERQAAERAWAKLKWNRKQKPCWDYQERGCCVRGDACNYSHDPHVVWLERRG